MSTLEDQTLLEKEIRDNHSTFKEEANRIKTEKLTRKPTGQTTGQTTVKRNSLKTKKKKKRKPTVKSKSLEQIKAMAEYDEQVFSHPSSTQATTTPTLRQNTLEKAVFTPLPSPSKRIQVRFEHVNPDTLIKRNVAKTRRGGKKKRRRTRKKRRKKTRKKRKRRKTRKKRKKHKRRSNK